MKRLAVLGYLILTGSVLAQLPEYQGPAILSRGVGTMPSSGGDLVRLRPFFSVTGIYDNGLTPVAVDAQGKIPQVDAYGVEGEIGVVGYHSWRRSILGLDYRGNFRHYTQNTAYDGSDQILSLGLTHQVSRRVMFSLREAGGTYARDYGGFSSAAFLDPRFANVPGNQLFDGRTYYSSSMADVTFQKNSRLSFNFGGTGTVVRYRAGQLIGVTAASARGDVAYRVTRNQTIGLDYGYSHYAFTNAFGSSDVNSLAFDYATNLGRDWHFALRGGVARVETLGLRRVSIDPIIAAIIRQAAGVQVFYQTNYIPTGDASLSRTSRRSNVSLFYRVGSGYGNGIYLTSRTQSAGAYLSYTAAKKWNVGVSGSYDTISSLGQSIGAYQGYMGGGGVTYQIVRSLHLVTRFDARHYEAAAANLMRVTYRGTVGFAFSPGELPLSLW